MAMPVGNIISSLNLSVCQITICCSQNFGGFESGLKALFSYGKKCVCASCVIFCWMYADEADVK